ncbi:MAG: porin, partial [Pseudolabrys sp.]
MKMVKSLLLGSAAGLVAVAGAQAADLPVKAKPVEYVKICSLYGVGFYYIPGTDMCIKIGGWVRAEYGWGQNGNFAWGWASNNLNNRQTNNSDFRARGYITADARNQTEYGTVRGYIAVGLSENEHGGDVNAANTFVRTAPSSSGRASPSVWRSRSLTSTARRRRRTGASSRALTP